MASAPYGTSTIIYEIDSMNGVCKHDISKDIMRHALAREILFIEDVSSEQDVSSAEECDNLIKFCDSFSDKIIVFQAGSGNTDSNNTKIRAMHLMYFKGTRFTDVSHLASDPGKDTYIYLNDAGSEAIERLEIAVSASKLRSLLEEYDINGGRTQIFKNELRGDIETIKRAVHVLNELLQEESDSTATTIKSF